MCIQLECLFKRCRFSINSHILHCASEEETDIKMPHQIEDSYDYIQDLDEKKDDEFFQEQLKRWKKLKHAFLVIFFVIFILMLIKCMKYWFKKKNRKGKFEFMTFYDLSINFITILAASQVYQSAASIETVESSDTQIVVEPSAPYESTSQPPSYFEAVNLGKGNKV